MLGGWSEFLRYLSQARRPEGRDDDGARMLAPHGGYQQTAECLALVLRDPVLLAGAVDALDTGAELIAAAALYKARK